MTRMEIVIEDIRNFKFGKNFTNIEVKVTGDTILTLSKEMKEKMEILSIYDVEITIGYRFGIDFNFKMKDTKDEFIDFDVDAFDLFTVLDCECASQFAINLSRIGNAIK